MRTAKSKKPYPVDPLAKIMARLELAEEALVLASNMSVTERGSFERFYVALNKWRKLIGLPVIR